MRRAQVFVEALIAEVTADKAAEFGIQWQALTGSNSTQHAASSAAPISATRGAAEHHRHRGEPGDASARASTSASCSGRISIPGIGTIANLALLARALETDVNANILSTPTLLTLDNEEARIVVGQNVPFITGQYAPSGGTTTPTPFQTVERRDVGLTLRVKPQISEGGTVRLQIYQEVSSVQDQINPRPASITNKRALRIDGAGRRRRRSS